MVLGEQRELEVSILGTGAGPGRRAHRVRAPDLREPRAPRRSARVRGSSWRIRAGDAPAAGRLRDPHATALPLQRRGGGRASGWTRSGSGSRPPTAPTIAYLSRPRAPPEDAGRRAELLAGAHLAVYDAHWPHVARPRARPRLAGARGPHGARASPGPWSWPATTVRPAGPEIRSAAQRHRRQARKLPSSRWKAGPTASTARRAAFVEDGRRSSGRGERSPEAAAGSAGQAAARLRTPVNQILATASCSRRRSEDEGSRLVDDSRRSSCRAPAAPGRGHRLAALRRPPRRLRGGWRPARTRRGGDAPAVQRTRLRPHEAAPAPTPRHPESPRPRGGRQRR